MPTKHLSIAQLLETAVQPFPDMDGEQFGALTADIPIDGPLPIPVSVTSDGILLDGHQRLRALQARGRKYVKAEDVRIIRQANADNALEWAARLNLVRRKLTPEQYGDWAITMQAEQGWSQGKLAEIAGVTRPRVSQWIKAARDAGNTTPAPETVESKDGTVRPSTAAANTTPATPSPPPSSTKATKPAKGTKTVIPPSPDPAPDPGWSDYDETVSYINVVADDIRSKFEDLSWIGDYDTAEALLAEMSDLHRAVDYAGEQIGERMGQLDDEASAV